MLKVCHHRSFIFHGLLKWALIAHFSWCSEEVPINVCRERQNDRTNDIVITECQFQMHDRATLQAGRVNETGQVITRAVTTHCSWVLWRAAEETTHQTLLQSDSRRWEVQTGSRRDSSKLTQLPKLKLTVSTFWELGIFMTKAIWHNNVLEIPSLLNEIIRLSSRLLWLYSY